jgi:hypothetical protein
MAVSWLAENVHAVVAHSRLKNDGLIKALDDSVPYNVTEFAAEPILHDQPIPKTHGDSERASENSAMPY